MFILTWWGLITTTVDYNLAYGRCRKEMERCIEPKFQCQSHMICRETQILWQWWCKLGCFLANIYIYEICSMLIDASQTATKYIPMCLHYTHPSKKLLAGGFSNNPLYTKMPRVHIKRGGGFKQFFIFTPIWGRFPFWLIFFKWVEITNQKNPREQNNRPPGKDWWTIANPNSLGISFPPYENRHRHRTWGVAIAIAIDPFTTEFLRWWFFYVVGTCWLITKVATWWDDARVSTKNNGI